MVMPDWWRWTKAWGQSMRAVRLGRHQYKVQSLASVLGLPVYIHITYTVNVPTLLAFNLFRFGTLCNYVYTVSSNVIYRKPADCFAGV